jgi:hypothetical protein
LPGAAMEVDPLTGRRSCARRERLLMSARRGGCSASRCRVKPMAVFDRSMSVIPMDQRVLMTQDIAESLL